MQFRRLNTAGSSVAWFGIVRSEFGFGMPNPCTSSAYRNRVRCRCSAPESRSMGRSENLSGFFNLLITCGFCS